MYYYQVYAHSLPLQTGELLRAEIVPELFDEVGRPPMVPNRRMSIAGTVRADDKLLD